MLARMIPSFAVLLGIASFLGCGADEPAVGEQLHPTEANRPVAEELSVELTRADTVADGALGELARSLRSATRVLAMGVLEGAEGETFGLVEDIVPMPDGDMAVLDSRFNEVRSYTEHGAALDRFGREGGGPNEFRVPESMESMGGRLAVLDRGAVVKLFQRSGDSWEYVDQIQLGVAPEDFCAFDDRLFVQGVRMADATVVHSFAPTGKHLASFGPAYKTDDTLVRNQLSDGLIACSDEASVLAMAPKYFPYVYGLTSEDGQVDWRASIAEFNPLKITSGFREGKPFVFFEQPSTFNRIVSLVGTGSHILVQVGRYLRNPGGAPDLESIQSYLLSADSGDGVYVGENLPIIYAIADRRAYGAVNAPFPQVQVYEFGSQGRLE